MLSCTTQHCCQSVGLIPELPCTAPHCGRVCLGDGGLRRVLLLRPWLEGRARAPQHARHARRPSRTYSYAHSPPLTLWSCAHAGRQCEAAGSSPSGSSRARGDPVCPAPAAATRGVRRRRRPCPGKRSRRPCCQRAGRASNGAAFQRCCYANPCRCSASPGPLGAAKRAAAAQPGGPRGPGPGQASPAAPLA